MAFAPLTPPPARPAPQPITVRLPREKERCPHTGLSREALKALALPCKANGYSPPVRSFLFRAPGNIRGSRLIVWESLRAYIESQLPASARPSGSATTGSGTPSTPTNPTGAASGLHPASPSLASLS